MDLISLTHEFYDAGVPICSCPENACVCFPRVSVCSGMNDEVLLNSLTQVTSPPINDEVCMSIQTFVVWSSNTFIVCSKEAM